MSSPTPPFDLTAISVPLPDPAHEAMRVTVLAVISEMWAQHLDLVDRVAALEAAVRPALPAAVATATAAIT